MYNTTMYIYFEKPQNNLKSTIILVIDYLFIIGVNKIAGFMNVKM